MQCPRTCSQTQRVNPESPLYSSVLRNSRHSDKCIEALTNTLRVMATSSLARARALVGCAGSIVAFHAAVLQVHGADQPVRSAVGARVAHVLVALADNKYQGIVPVPAAIGNGDDPVRNLYWG